MKTVFALSLLPLSASLAFADDVAERRATCTPLVTAIYDACEVVNHFSCPDGSVFAETLSPDLPLRVSLFNSAYQMEYDYTPSNGRGAFHVIETFDPFEMDLLLSNGTETESLQRYAIGFFGDESYVVDSRYVLTAEQRAFSVGDMRVIEFTQQQIVGYAGNAAIAAGHVYLDESLGRYFLGAVTVSFNGAEIVLPNLIDIVGPASPFFMTQNPEDTCQDPLS